MSLPDRPTKEALDQILAAVGPRVEELLRRHGRTPKTAMSVLETLISLAHEWSGIENRERWLLDRIEKAMPKERPPDEELPL